MLAEILIAAMGRVTWDTSKFSSMAKFGLSTGRTPDNPPKCLIPFFLCGKKKIRPFPYIFIRISPQGCNRSLFYPQMGSGIEKNRQKYWFTSIFCMDIFCCNFPSLESRKNWKEISSNSLLLIKWRECAVNHHIFNIHFWGLAALVYARARKMQKSMKAALPVSLPYFG